jgi:hypothetical protein
MQTVVGIFTVQAQAERAAERLYEFGIARKDMYFLTRRTAARELAEMPTSDTEQPGMGAALGGVVGGAVGASGGMMGAVVLSALIPGFGALGALGLGLVSLLGLAGGAATGAAAGGALEEAMTDGLPKDELFIYADALRQGKKVLVVLTQDSEQTAAVRAILMAEGAESLDAARDTWWLGTRDAEAAEYTAEGQEFQRDEPLYRRGFEAALHPDVAGKGHEEVMEYLRIAHADVYTEEAFRRGFARGRAYYEQHYAVGREQ